MWCPSGRKKERIIGVGLGLMTDDASQFFSKRLYMQYEMHQSLHNIDEQQGDVTKVCSIQ